MVKFSKRILFSLFLVLGFGSIFGSFVISDWRDTQSLSYQSGLGQQRSLGEFSLNGCGSGTILDNVTELCWQQSPSVLQVNWTDAVNYCDNLNLGGHTDWVLPQKAQLLTLVQNNGFSSTAVHLNNNIGFSGIQNDGYWTSTIHSSTRAYQVSFSSDQSGSGVFSWGIYYALCVRR